MKVNETAAKKLFLEMGVTTADSWSAARLKSKIATLPKISTGDNAPKSEDSKKLQKALIKAVNAEEDIEIESDGKAKKAEAPSKETKSEKTSKASAPKAEAEDEDEEDADEDDEESDDEEESDDDSETDEDDEDEEEDDEDKPAKKKKVKKEKKEKAKTGPGVIASIEEFLRGASEDKPLSKEKLADKLAARFADHERDSMLRTINVQVPNRLKVDKEIIVHKNKGGYWIGAAPTKKDEEPESKKAKKKKDKAAKKAAKEEADDDEE